MIRQPTAHLLCSHPLGKKAIKSDNTNIKLSEAYLVLLGRPDKGCEINCGKKMKQN